MATRDWPTWLTTDPSPELQPDYKVITQESMGGKEFQVQLASVSRREFFFTVRVHSVNLAASGPWPAGSTELAAFTWLLEDAFGPIGRFNVIDPSNPGGSTVLCRLEDPMPKLRQAQGAPWFEAQVHLIQVI